MKEQQAESQHQPSALEGEAQCGPIFLPWTSLAPLSRAPLQDLTLARLDDDQAQDVVLIDLKDKSSGR